MSCHVGGKGPSWPAVRNLYGLDEGFIFVPSEREFWSRSCSAPGRLRRFPRGTPVRAASASRPRRLRAGTSPFQNKKSLGGKDGANLPF